MLCCTTGGGFVRAGVGAVTLISSAIPILLMWTYHGETWAKNYNSEVTLSILLVGLVANTFVTGRAVRPLDWIRAAASSIILSALILFALLITGSTLQAIWASLVSGAYKIGGNFYHPPDLEPWFSLTWVVSVAAALVVSLKGRGASLLAPLACIKAIYGLMGTLELVFNPTAQLGCLLPWAWLLIVGTKEKDNDLFPRIFLSFLAVWQGLQAYPVAGTQVAVGTFIGVLVYSVCLWDAMRVFAASSLLRLPLSKVESIGGGRWAQIGAFLALLSVFTMRWCEPIRNWQEYQAKQPLDLPGCYSRRTAPAAATEYRKLAKFLDARSDTFSIFPGLNSMYFWTGKRPPAYFIISGEGNMPTKSQQLEIVEALKRAKRPLVVLREMDWSFGQPYGELKEGPMADFVHTECYQVDAFAQFKILAPRHPFKTPESATSGQAGGLK